MLDTEKILPDRYEMKYNGVEMRSFGIVLYDYPSFSGAKKNYSSTAVQGRIGQLVGETNYVSNLSIECEFTVVGRAFMERIRRIKLWLSGTGKIEFSDYPGSFFKVWKVEYGNIERELKTVGRFSVTFICTPFEFLDIGQHPAAGLLLYNDGSTARPIYNISGNGDCVLTVNGKTMEATIGQNLTIDTEQMLAYRTDGTLQNTAVTGDYEDLFLIPGENEISITEGFSLSVIPQWGYDF